MERGDGSRGSSALCPAPSASTARLQPQRVVSVSPSGSAARAGRGSCHRPRTPSRLGPVLLPGDLSLSSLPPRPNPKPAQVTGSEQTGLVGDHVALLRITLFLMSRSRKVRPHASRCDRYCQAQAAGPGPRRDDAAADSRSRVHVKASSAPPALSASRQPGGWATLAPGRSRARARRRRGVAPPPTQPELRSVSTFAASRQTARGKDAGLSPHSRAHEAPGAGGPGRVPALVGKPRPR